MSRIRIAYITTAIVAVLLRSAIGQALAGEVPLPFKLERITAFVSNEVATGKIPGAVILIEQHDQPLYLKSFGVQDVQTGTPMGPNTIFAIHSMTKPITCVAAMMLVDESKLSLQDPLSKFIPSFAHVEVGQERKMRDGTTWVELMPPKRPITILDLMRHTSGTCSKHPMVANGRRTRPQIFCLSAINLQRSPFNTSDMRLFPRSMEASAGLQKRC